MDRHRSRLVILLAHEQWEGIAFANFGEGYLYALKRQGSNECLSTLRFCIASIISCRTLKW